MPLLQINTNVSVQDTSSILKEASKFVATLLGKPESYVMVILNPDVAMSFAGSDKDSAHLTLKSLGLPESETANYSAQLCEFIEQQLNIPAARIYIEFDSPARHMWGWDNKTF